ncbi:unnamed protein product [Protopolystoma xenopodis]|uniref:Uncharacterized protein n=1 Tax=Protopolystoma xenopodis TaxID=117903 RepID=A0A448WPN8_9PLAT|nr:unnamed protein product [Protopolystoma xenopodis]
MAGAQTENMPEQALHTYVVSSFISAIQQSVKMGMGEMKRMITRYQDMQIVQFNYTGDQKFTPIYLTVVGQRACDVDCLGFPMATVDGSDS